MEGAFSSLGKLPGNDDRKQCPAEGSAKGHNDVELRGRIGQPVAVYHRVHGCDKRAQRERERERGAGGRVRGRGALGDLRQPVHGGGESGAQQHYTLQIERLDDVRCAARD